MTTRNLSRHRRHRLVGLALVAAVLTACDSPRTTTVAAPDPPASPHAVTPTPGTPVAMPSTVTRTADSSTPPSTRTGLAEQPLVNPRTLAQLDPSKRKLLERMKKFCAAGVRRDAQVRWKVGCRACPPYDSTMAIEPVRLLDYGESPFSEVTDIIAGSFSAAGVDEVAVVSPGCDEDDRTDAGITVLRRAGTDAWTVQATAHGWEPDSCLALRRNDGRDLLVCRFRERRGNVFHHALATYDFSSAPGTLEAKRNEIWVLDNDAADYCIRSSAGQEVHETVVAGQIDGIRAEPVARSSSQRVVVSAHRIRTHPTFDYRAACKRWIGQKARSNPRYIDVTPSLRARPIRLFYEWRDNNLVPSVRTRRVLSQNTNEPIKRPLCSRPGPIHDRHRHEASR